MGGNGGKWGNGRKSMNKLRGGGKMEEKEENGRWLGLYTLQRDAPSRSKRFNRALQESAGPERDVHSSLALWDSLRQ